MSLSSRYIPDRFLPDKAIDVMDEAGSRVRMENHAARRVAAQGRLHLMEWEQLIEVLDAKDQAIQVSKSPTGRVHRLCLSIRLAAFCQR